MIAAVQPSQPVMFSLPALVKGRIEDGRKVLEVEASCQETDTEGDLILQKALLDSAVSFLSHGHVDVDHLSELGPAMGIPDPEDWIIGRPVDVLDGGRGRTLVKALIQAARPVGQDRADAFWASLQSGTAWRASVYGFMGPDTVDCREEACQVAVPGLQPTRFLVRSFDWKSLAMTRNPINQGLKGYARIVKAADVVGRIQEALAGGRTVEEVVGLADREGPLPLKAAAWQDPGPQPHLDALSAESCPTCGGLREAVTMPVWRRHLSKCLGWPAEQAEIGAHAAMHMALSRAAVPVAMMALSRGVPVIYGPGNESLDVRSKRQQRFSRQIPT